MKRLQGMDEYKSLLKELKKEHKTVFSNLYFMPKDIDRYISLERAEYEKKEEGLLFYFDEDTYYRVCMCVEAGESFNISGRDKKIVVRNVYRKNEQDEKLNDYEKELERNGFNLVGTTLQVQVNVQELLKKNIKLEKYVSIMNKRGYYCVTANMEMLMEMRRLIEKSKTLKDYHIDYRTPEETMEDLSEGGCLCIVDKQGQVCAGGYTYIKNGLAIGAAIVVDEKYKMSGFAPVLTYERCKRLAEREIKNLSGWVMADNDASFKYHKSMGFQFTGIYADEWILNKK